MLKLALPVVAAWLVLRCSSCSASPEGGLRMLFAPEAAAPPSIDGSLNETCWKEARWAGAMLGYNTDGVVEAQTHFAAAHDAKNLYFAFRCEAPGWDGKVSPFDAAAPESWPSGDVVEIFLDPGLTRSHYYQFGVGPNGAQYDSERMDPKWNSSFFAATAGGKDGWTMEVAIPLKSVTEVGVRAGDLWGFNVCRDRPLPGKGTYELSMWSSVPGNFHTPSGFGQLAFGEPEDLLVLNLLPKVSAILEQAQLTVERQPKLAKQFGRELIRLQHERNRLVRETASGMSLDSLENFLRRALRLLDNARGLAGELAMVRALREAGVRTR